MNALRRSSRSGPWAAVSASVVAVLGLGSALSARAENWDEVEFIRHDTYQAVKPSGTDGYTNAYTGPFPMRLRGVVLNNTEDWLDATENYNEIPWNLGGEAEIFVQAVDLDGTSWDPDPANPFDDFGGTAAWMGQCYGNLGFIGDESFSYIDVAMAGQPGETRPVWYDESDRLGFNRPGTPLTTDQLVRAGNLVEIRARAGLYYKGKMNVNERHSNVGNDFEIIILDENYGLPTPLDISLSAIKDDADVPIFDPTRSAGGERYQLTWVQIENVRFEDDSLWGRNGELTLIDDTGRTLEVRLGLNDSFDAVPAPEGYFDVVGIIDQDSAKGMDGYRLLAMHADDFAPVPEPATLMLLAAGVATLLIGGRLRRRHNGW